MNSDERKLSIDLMARSNSIESKDSFINEISIPDIVWDSLGEQGSDNDVSTSLLFDEIEPVSLSCPSTSGVRFFESIEDRGRALKKATANALIAGNIKRGLECVRSNPWLIHAEIEETLIIGERSLTLKGTPLQILARLGDFNPFRREEKNHPVGAVERLIALDLLSADEIENQLRAVFPLGWDSEDAMLPLKAAVEKFFFEIEALDIGCDCPEIEALDAGCDFPWGWDKVRLMADEIVARFRKTIFGLPQPAFGFVFDQRIFPWFINRFWGEDGGPAWGDMLDGIGSAKSDLFLVVVLGSLQAADTPCGLQLHRSGVFKMVNRNNNLDRSMDLSFLPDFYPELGSSFFLSPYNGRFASPLYPKGPGRRCLPCYEQMLSTKNASLEKMMQTCAQPSLRS